MLTINVIKEIGEKILKEYLRGLMYFFHVLIFISLFISNRQKSGGKKEFALYNITADPTESFDLSKELPDVVAKLRARVRYYKRGMVLPANKPADPKAKKEARKNGYWGPWIS